MWYLYDFCFVVRFRDIHIGAWGFNKETHKAAGLQIKWDANRDPNQKLAVTLDFLNPAPYDCKGNFIVSYPGRTINGAFDFLLKGEEAHLIGNVDNAGTARMCVILSTGRRNFIISTYILHLAVCMVI